ncbi:hypothetical protein SDC9_65082 [bioreactor metagenome]|uniref:Uncharacterized protein n=1 Tax=bioreactor metagenome TaxID=1076179 RepID=A0A644XRF3_9ZZZZ
MVGGVIKHLVWALPKLKGIEIFPKYAQPCRTRFKKGVPRLQPRDVMFQHRVGIVDIGVDDRKVVRDDKLSPDNKPFGVRIRICGQDGLGVGAVGAGDAPNRVAGANGIEVEAKQKRLHDPPGLRADDTVRLKAEPALEALHCAAGRSAEFPAQGAHVIA